MSWNWYSAIWILLLLCCLSLFSLFIPLSKATKGLCHIWHCSASEDKSKYELGRVSALKEFLVVFVVLCTEFRRPPEVSQN